MSTDTFDKMQQAVEKTKQPDTQTTAVTTQPTQPINQWQALFDKNKTSILNATNGNEKLTNLYIREAITEIQLEPSLRDCSPLSLVKCVVQAAQCKLRVNSALGQAAIINYGGQATLQPMWQGRRTWFYRHPLAKVCYAREVREGDTFEWDETMDVPYHKPHPTQRGEAYCWYGVAKLKNGGVLTSVLYKCDIERKRKENPRRYQSKAWKTDYSEMAKKTALIDVLSYMPMDTDDFEENVSAHFPLSEGGREMAVTDIPNLHNPDDTPSDTADFDTYEEVSPNDF